MRSSKSRSRSKNNRNRNSLGNVVNRVFDSNGPEGKVRGTPQQIIDKYNQLARDAALGNDRVAAENFQQHAEHYLRMLSEAQREVDAKREQQERENRERQAQRDKERAERDAQKSAEREDRDSNQGQSDGGNGNGNGEGDFLEDWSWYLGVRPRANKSSVGAAVQGGSAVAGGAGEALDVPGTGSSGGGVAELLRTSPTFAAALAQSSADSPEMRIICVLADELGALRNELRAERRRTDVLVRRQQDLVTALAKASEDGKLVLESVNVSGRRSVSAARARRWTIAKTLAKASVVLSCLAVDAFCPEVASAAIEFAGWYPWTTVAWASFFFQA